MTKINRWFPLEAEFHKRTKQDRPFRHLKFDLWEHSKDKSGDVISYRLKITDLNRFGRQTKYPDYFMDFIFKNHLASSYKNKSRTIPYADRLCDPNPLLRENFIDHWNSLYSIKDDLVWLSTANGHCRVSIGKKSRRSQKNVRGVVAFLIQSNNGTMAVEFLYGSGNPKTEYYIRYVLTPNDLTYSDDKNQTIWSQTKKWSV